MQLAYLPQRLNKGVEGLAQENEKQPERQKEKQTIVAPWKFIEKKSYQEGGRERSSLSYVVLELSKMKPKPRALIKMEIIGNPKSHCRGKMRAKTQSELTLKREWGTANFAKSFGKSGCRGEQRKELASRDQDYLEKVLLCLKKGTIKDMTVTL